MALQLKIKVTESADFKSFTVSDQTGIYNNPNNLGGYGTANPAVSETLTAVLKITRPDSNTIYTINVFPTFPTITNTTLLTVHNTDIGLTASSKLPDGAWLVEYVITGIFASTPFTASIQCWQFFTGQVDCCLDGKILNIDLCDIKDCCNETIRTITQLRTLLCAAKSTARCGARNKATEILKYVSDACNCENFKSGCSSC